MKFYLAPPKMRVAPQMPPQIPRPGAATEYDIRRHRSYAWFCVIGLMSVNWLMFKQ